jgi:cysteine desulfurase
VKNVCEDLEKQGWKITYLPVYTGGIVRVEDVRSAIRDETVLISVMAANNEIGTLQPIEEIGRIVRELRRDGRKLFFHTDAVQAAGKIALDVEEIGCDLLSISAHKIYAAKGIGALYARRGVRLHAQNIGGHQERERRGGTEPVHLIAGFGRAAEIVAEEMVVESPRLATLRNKLEQAILERVPVVEVNGDTSKRLPHITNRSFSGIEGEGLLINLDMQGIAVSTGSACSSGTLEPSPVIRALGKRDDDARGAIRFSLGRFNSEEDIRTVVDLLPQSVENLRMLSPTGKQITAK